MGVWNVFIFTLSNLTDEVNDSLACVDNSAFVPPAVSIQQKKAKVDKKATSPPNISDVDFDC